MAKRPRIENLTVDQLVTAAELALANAAELRDEAALLAEHRKFARAYALAHTALEELSKIPMTIRLAADVEAGMEVDWPKLSRRFRDHRTKVTAHVVADYMLSDVRPDNSDVAAYFEDLERVPQRLDRRDASLYVDFEGVEFVQPSGRISETDSLAIRDYLAARLEFYQRSLPARAAALRHGGSEDEKAEWRRFRQALDEMGRGDASETESPGAP